MGSQSDNFGSSGWAILLYCLAVGTIIFICWFLYKRYCKKDGSESQNDYQAQESLLQQSNLGTSENQFKQQNFDKRVPFLSKIIQKQDETMQTQNEINQTQSQLKSNESKNQTSQTKQSLQNNSSSGDQTKIPTQQISYNNQENILKKQENIVQPLIQQISNILVDDAKSADSQISNNKDHIININQKDDFQLQQSNSPQPEIDQSQQYQVNKQDDFKLQQSNSPQPEIKLSQYNQENKSDDFQPQQSNPKQEINLSEKYQENKSDDFKLQQSNSPKQEIDQSQQYQENKQDYLLIVQQLYDLSINKREVEEEFRSFVGPPLNQKKLIQYYADDNEKIEDQLKKQLKGYRRIRGDGNCFYTAFTYQYLELALNVFDQKQFDQIIGHIRTMNFQMEYEEEFKIPVEAQNPLANCFADRLSELRHNPKDFFKQFSDPSNHLYGLSILYMRNLVNEIYLRNEIAQTIDATLSKDFLFWEKECNLNELVIAFLADELQLQINCYFIDQQSDLFKHDVYSEQCANQIHLILQPGHYQIGLKK